MMPARRHVANQAPRIRYSPVSRVWPTVAEVAGFLTVVVFVVGVMSIA